MPTSRTDSDEETKEGVVAQLSLKSPLNAISLSSDQRHGVVGGRDLMKVCYITYCNWFTRGKTCALCCDCTENICLT